MHTTMEVEAGPVESVMCNDRDVAIMPAAMEVETGPVESVMCDDQNADMESPVMLESQNDFVTLDMRDNWNMLAVPSMVGVQSGIDMSIMVDGQIIAEESAIIDLCSDDEEECPIQPEWAATPKSKQDWNASSSNGQLHELVMTKGTVGSRSSLKRDKKESRVGSYVVVDLTRSKRRRSGNVCSGR